MQIDSPFKNNLRAIKVSAIVFPSYDNSRAKLIRATLITKFSLQLTSKYVNVLTQNLS